MFLDRDGVLNESVVRNGKPHPPDTLDELRIIPGTREALARLKERGFLLLVVTNQPDVARGSQSRSAVEEMHQHLRRELPLDDVFTCFHDDADSCECRKPKPGLITRAAQEYGIDLNQSFLVGDRWRDIDAGAKAGCRTIWIDRGYQERSPSAAPDVRAESLSDGVDWILKSAANTPVARSRSVRAIALNLFAALFAIYLSMSPGTISGYGYASEEMESGLRMMSIVTAVSKGRPVPPMIWSRHGPMPVLFDLPFLKLGKVFATPDFALSFEPVLFTAGLMAIVFLWLRVVCSPATSLFLTLSGAFGTMLWPYAYIGLETKQSFFILLAGYLGLALGKIRGWPRLLGFAVVCALGLTVKAIGVVMWPAVAYLFYVQFRDDWRQRWGQLLTSGAAVVAICAANVMLRNFYWTPLGGGESAIKGWIVQSNFQIFTNLVGVFGSPAKGLFVFAPILIAILWAIPRAFRTHRDIAIFSTLVLVCTVGLLSILTYTTDETWGSRYLHVAIAPLLVCIGAAWPSLQWRVHTPLAVLAVVGVAISFLGAFFYYGGRGTATDDAGQNTMEWLTSDNVWNEAAFDARLFQVWWHGGSDPVPWTPTHLWVWTPPKNAPPWRTIDLRKYADSQSFLFYNWNRPRDRHQETLLRFYLFCAVAGALLLLRTAWVSLEMKKGEAGARIRSLSRTKVVGGLAIGAIVALAGVWMAGPTMNAPKLALDKNEVVAGRDSFTARVEGMSGEEITVRYSIDGGAPEEMGALLDSNGSVRFDVSAETRKGVYRWIAFKKKQDVFWFNTDVSITVK